MEMSDANPESEPFQYLSSRQSSQTGHIQLRNDVLQIPLEVVALERMPELDPWWHVCGEFALVDVSVNINSVLYVERAEEADDIPRNNKY